jgi:hypothetical protein
MLTNKLFFVLIILLNACLAFGQNKFNVSGTVKDAQTGETLIGATIRLIGNNNVVAITNAYGYFALKNTAGNYTIEISYAGYKCVKRAIKIIADIKLNESLEPQNNLDEVIISASARKDENVKSAQMGLNRINLSEINSLPALLGEKDVLKTIQLLPGIKTAGEGNTGFYVRGGASDQNLILLDEAVVYNSSHLLGFFSTFNADAVKDVSLYKGGMPAQYGGRLSSVLDVKMIEGNNKNFQLEGGIGLVASRLKAEGPIVKDKASFMLSLRRTYIDMFLKASSDSSINGSTLNFYDVNLKANHKLNDKNTLYISGYFGKDNIGVKDLFDNNWGNITTTVRLNHIFTDRLFSNTSLIFNRYNFSIKLLNDAINFKAASLIRDFNLKQDFQFFSNKHLLRFGLNSTHHSISPIDITSTESSQINNLNQENKYGLENALYISDEWSVTENLTFLYGLRLSEFSLLGPGTFKSYNANKTIISSETVGSGTFYKNYFNLEPRFSVSYMLNQNNSIKISFNRNTQNIHILSNSTSSSPADQYVMSSNNIKPEIADQIALGFFKNLENNGYEFSSELYYKRLENQIEYKNAAQLLANENVESELLYGMGRAYGLELFFKKNKGKLNGWIGYTLSKTERKFEGINNGNYFNAKQDRTHDLSVVAIYNLNKRWIFSSNLIYSTGNAVTFPAGKYTLAGQTMYYYTDRNAGRMPYTMRVDVSATLDGKAHKKYRSSWNFGVYNLLGRKNPYSIEFINDESNPGKTVAQQISLFGLIPSVTWNFKFF